MTEPLVRDVRDLPAAGWPLDRRVSVPTEAEEPTQRSIVPYRDEREMREWRSPSRPA